MSARLADIAHKSFVTLLAGVTVVGLVDIGFMHRNIMATGRDELARQEMDRLREQRDAHEPFPQGTDLHATSSQQQARI